MAELENLKGKNWIATMALCWGLGYFGAHRFYTGKSGSAWAIAVMSITGLLAPISAIWVLVDGITIALGHFKHADGSDLYERVPWFGYLYIVIIVLGIIASVLYAAALFAIVGAAMVGAIAG